MTDHPERDHEPITLPDNLFDDEPAPTGDEDDCVERSPPIEAREVDGAEKKPQQDSETTPSPEVESERDGARGQNLSQALSMMVEQQRQQTQLLSQLMLQQTAQSKAIVSLLEAKEEPRPSPPLPEPEVVRQVAAPPLPPAPPLPLSADFMREWGSVRDEERLVRVTYVGQGTHVAFDQRHALLIPAGVALSLEELQRHAEYCGWPHVAGMRLWLEWAEQPDEGNKYLTSCTCRPPQHVIASPQFTAVLQQLEALQETGEQMVEVGETWVDKAIELIQPFIPQLQMLVAAWFAQNKDRMFEGIGKLMEWLTKVLAGQANASPVQGTIP